jgi:C4-dicarboxylate transporter/malic acid transport protein
MHERHIIKYFAPGWFAVIMGTGGLGNILFVWQRSFPWLEYAGAIVAGMADMLYFLVLIPWLIRWFKYFDYVKRDLHNPIATNFFVTMPIATVIVGTNIYMIWSQYLTQDVVFILTFSAWIVSIIGVTFFTFYTTFRLMRIEVAPQPETMNFSWIMAPIANMAVLLIGNPVHSIALLHRPSWCTSIFITNIALFGFGFFLFIFISAIIFVRLAHHPLPPAETTPSFGIFLSAVGLAVSAIIDLAKNAQAMNLISETSISSLCAAVIWGFGIWIVGIIIMICIHQLRRGGIPFNLGWWAFIFPLAAYTICSQKIEAHFTSPLTFGYTVFLTTLLSALWLYIIINTVKGVVNGNLFIGKPIIRSKSNY